ncbi:MAG TPA: SDR family NAD(P)-dependent oxidoreductase [Longimicrobium sp.]|nr:SDR family NAD(P)-dependent oxidoreductase [Longimicrobium sp.]
MAGGRMEGRVCVITGATAGMGQATAMELARRGATVVLVARSRQKAERTRAEVVRAAGHDGVGIVLADLSSQAQVRAAAAEIDQRWPAVHVLINNAAAYTRRREETVDGIEMQLAVNHLAPFLLTNLLLYRLRAGAQARVVTFSSGAHRYGRIRWDDPGLSRGYNGLLQYSNTKLFNVLFTRELARRVPPPTLTANALHPGVVGTALLLGGWAPLKLFKRWMRTPEQGARTAIWLATSPEVANVTGEYFRDERPARVAPAALDDDAARRLWELSAQLTGLDATASDNVNGG